MPKICDMHGVRGSDTGFTVQLCRDEETHRLVVRGINEGGFACVDIDLFDLVGWLSTNSPGAMDFDSFCVAFASRYDSLGHESRPRGAAVLSRSVGGADDS